MKIKSHPSFHKMNAILKEGNDTSFYALFVLRAAILKEGIDTYFYAAFVLRVMKR